MKFLRDWLRVDRPTGVALHATQIVEIDAPLDEVFDRCVTGIEQVLGGIVCEADRARGTVEAAFGLVHGERLTCSVQARSEQQTRVVIESRRGASAQPATTSDYVRALAEFLRK